jgi:hypothetical protein
VELFSCGVCMHDMHMVDVRACTKVDLASGALWGPNLVWSGSGLFSSVLRGSDDVHFLSC